MKKKFCFVFLWLVVFSKVWAQPQEDTMALYRQYIALCQQYHRLPLHLKVQINMATNYIISEADTARKKVEFFFTPSASYVRVDELEQIVGDSLALVVNDYSKQMYLFPNTELMNACFSNFTGMPFSDTSVKELAAQYIINKQNTVKDNQINLQSRSLLPGTSLAVSQINCRFDPQTLVPKEVAEVKRSLMAIDTTTYQRLSLKSDMSYKLLSIPDQGYYVIREHAFTYTYLKVDHQSSITIPVQISDRVQKSNNNDYEPLSAFPGYIIVKNMPINGRSIN